MTDIKCFLDQFVKIYHAYFGCNTNSYGYVLCKKCQKVAFDEVAVKLLSMI